MQRPFQFAVQSFSAPSAAQWRERARRAEDLGYAALHLADHFLGPGPALAATNHPLQELAAVPAIMAAADATRSLRVGARVFCNDYRHPVMLAKETATLDLLSEGRLDVGLGAGWLEAEYAAAGIPFAAAAQRIERLGETVALLRQLWSGEPVAFEGRFYRVSGFCGAPRPLQRPHPPLMIGGGSRRVLELAAREADVVSLNFDNRSGVIGPDGVRSGGADATDRKVAWVRAAAGARAPVLEIGAYFTFVTDRARQTAAGLGAALGLEADEMLSHPHALIGSVDALCEELLRRRERYGISRVTVGDNALEPFAPVVARLAGR